MTRSNLKKLFILFFMIFIFGDVKDMLSSDLSNVQTILIEMTTYNNYSSSCKIDRIINSLPFNIKESAIINAQEEYNKIKSECNTYEVKNETLKQIIQAYRKDLSSQDNYYVDLGEIKKIVDCLPFKIKKIYACLPIKKIREIRDSLQKKNTCLLRSKITRPFLYYRAMLLNIESITLQLQNLDKNCILQMLQPVNKELKNIFLFIDSLNKENAPLKDQEFENFFNTVLTIDQHILDISYYATQERIKIWINKMDNKIKQNYTKKHYNKRIKTDFYSNQLNSLLALLNTDSFIYLINPFTKYNLNELKDGSSLILNSCMKNFVRLVEKIDQNKYETEDSKEDSIETIKQINEKFLQIFKSINKDISLV